MAGAAGLVCVFGFAPFYLFPLPVISYLVLAAMLAAAPDAKRALATGYCFGLGYFLGGVSWVFVSLHVYGGMPFWMAGLATLGFCAFLALYPAFACWAGWRLGGQSPHARYWLMAIGLAAMEWVRGWLFTGFPWFNPGYSQAPYSPLGGYAPLLGVYGIALLVILTGFALSSMLAKRAGVQRRAILAVLVVTVWGVGAALNHIEWTQPLGEPTKVALIQGNIEQDRKFLESELVGTFILYRDRMLASNAKLIVMPETALPIFLHQIPKDYLLNYTLHARSLGGDVVVGVPEYDEKTQQYYNSVISLGSSPTQRYRKSHLAPFGEYIPLKPIFGVFYRWLNMPLSDFGRGDTHQKPMSVAGQKVAVNICYEDLFGEEIIRQVPESTLLLNVTNDAWWGRSFAAMQHLQISQMRSMETGRALLRVTNTGITAIIDHKGLVADNHQAPWFVQTTLTGWVQGMTGNTPFTVYGNVPAILLMLGGIIAAVGYRLVSTRRH